MLMMMGAMQLAVATLPSEKMLLREPIMELEGQRDADDLAQCVGLALEPIGKPVLTRLSDRLYVTFGSVDRSLVLITIYKGQPTRLQVRRSFAFNKKWRNRIRFCAS